MAHVVTPPFRPRFNYCQACLLTAWNISLQWPNKETLQDMFHNWGLNRWLATLERLTINFRKQGGVDPRYTNDHNPPSITSAKQVPRSQKCKWSAINVWDGGSGATFIIAFKSGLHPELSVRKRACEQRNQKLLGSDEFTRRLYIGELYHRTACVVSLAIIRRGVISGRRSRWRVLHDRSGSHSTSREFSITAHVIFRCSSGK